MYKNYSLAKLPLYASISVLGIMVLLTYLPIHTDLWRHFSAEPGIDKTFCEFSRPNCLIREPMNTLTNILYFFFGAMVLFIAAKDNYRKKVRKTHYRNLMVRQPVWGFILGGVFMFLFLGSTFFHASLIKIAQQLDMGGVNALALFPIFYSFHKLYNLKINNLTYQSDTKGTAFFVVTYLLAAIILTLFKWQLNATIVIPLLVAIQIVLIIYLERLIPNTTSQGWIYVGAACIVGGMIFYAIDMKKIGCFGAMQLQPHALWHISAGIASFALYLYLRSENMEDKFREYGVYI